MAVPPVAAEPVWATLLAAKESVWGAIFELLVPGCSCAVPEGHAGRYRRCDFDAAAAAVAVRASPAPCSRCVQVQPIAAFAVAELMMIDDNSILML